MTCRSLPAMAVSIAVLFAALFTANFASAAGTSQVVFCVAGDSRGTELKHAAPINKNVLSKLVRALKAEKPQFVLFTGDLVSGYSRDLEKQLMIWRDTFMKPLLDAGIKVYSCRGNHDKSLGGRSKKNAALKIWNKVFSGKFAFPKNGPKNALGVTYFVRDNNVLALILDNYKDDGYPHKVDVAWMNKIITKEKRIPPSPLHIFAICHEPAFTVIHQDCLANNKRARDDFLKSFLKAGGVAFFCGHDHLYNHSKIKLREGIFHQFVCGGAGAPLVGWKGKYLDKRVAKVKSSKAFGYMLVKVVGNKATLTAKSWNSKGTGSLKTIDKLTYTLKK